MRPVPKIISAHYQLMAWFYYYYTTTAWNAKSSEHVGQDIRDMEALEFCGL
jgi:hypothetical protein